MIRLSCCIPGGSLMPEGEGAVPQSPAEQIIEKCRYLLSLGYDNTECTGGMLYSLTDEELDFLVAENKKSSLGLVSVNSLFPGEFRLADPDADHTPYYERAGKTFDIMQKLDIPYAVFGSGGARRLIPEKEGSREALYEFLKNLATMAGERGITLLIEPLQQRESNVFNTVPEAGEIIREIGHPNLRLLCDSFHMAIENTDLSCIREYSDLTDHCHIAEAQKRTPPGTDGGGDPNYNRIFAAELIKSGYEGAVSIECGFRDFKTDVKNSLEYMKEIFREAETVEITPIRDLTEEPVYLVPKKGAVSPKITSATANGKTFPAAQYKDGVLVILTAKKGEVLTLTLGTENVDGAPTAVNLPDENKVEVKIGGARFSDYVYDPAIPKPFFGQVTDSHGNGFTRLDLNTREHVHQRSVFVAVGDVNGVDCWNETTGHGYVKNESITDVTSTAAYASFRANNRWTDHDGNPLVSESTKYTVYNQSDDCRALDLEITFTAEYGDVNFGATKEAGPLGIRMRDELRADIGVGELSNSWGGVGERECWSRSAEWCDYCGEPEGIGPMGVTVFDNEKNERFPTAWHIRAYGLFAANNLFFKGGLTIKSGESLTYRFRILFRRVPMSRDELSDRFVQYTVNPIA